MSSPGVLAERWRAPWGASKSPGALPGHSGHPPSGAPLRGGRPGGGALPGGGGAHRGDGGGAHPGGGHGGGPTPALGVGDQPGAWAAEPLWARLEPARKAVSAGSRPRVPAVLPPALDGAPPPLLPLRCFRGSGAASHPEGGRGRGGAAELAPPRRPQPRPLGSSWAEPIAGTRTQLEPIRPQRLWGRPG